ncbi:MAG: acyltransferase family protein [Cellvibrio sp.]
MALSAEQADSGDSRFHALDATRACALLAGIVLHSITSFLPGFREANWPLSDNSTNAGLAVLFFVIHLFRMSLFFIIAGFFARLLYKRYGMKDFIKNRLQRIGLPFVAFYLVIMPFTVIAIIWGARQLGIQGPPKTVWPIPIIGPPVPWGHLWFLYLLLVIYTLALTIRAIVTRLDANNVMSEKIGELLNFFIRTRFAALILTLPIAVSLFFSTWWQQWFGIPSPIVGLVPNLPALMAYGGAFLVGWFLHRHQESLSVLAKDWFLYFVAALISTITAIYIVGVTPKFEVIALNKIEQALYASAYIFAQWCWAFAIIGIAIKYFKKPDKQWRYLADASYWMYLIHLPIVWLLQAWMLSWPLHWSIKLPSMLLITSFLLLASYHYLVRSTFMGKFLNGKKYPRI